MFKNRKTKVLLIILLALIISAGIIIWPGRLYKFIQDRWGQKESTQTLQEQASSKIADDKYSEAKPILEEIIKQDPENAKAWTDLGMCYFYLKDPQKAQEAFSAAVKYDPNSSSLYNLLGNAQRDTADLEGAKASYQKSIDLNKSQFNAYINLSSLLYNQAKYDEAISVLIEGKTEIPKYMEIRYMLASFYKNLGQTANYNKEIKEILAINPNDKWALSNKWEIG